jgi:hypothetical protein
VSLISQYDVELLQHIEDRIGKKLEMLEGVQEDMVLKGINKWVIVCNSIGTIL